MKVTSKKKNKKEEQSLPSAIYLKDLNIKKNLE